MENLLAIENKLISMINADIESSFGTEEELRRDPLGDAIYLFFLLKNNKESPAIDNLIDWMNAWIENKMKERKFTRFVDRELTSALLGYYSLRSANRLHTKVDIKEVNELVSKFIIDDSIFNNFTYSTIILLSLADQRDKIPSFNSVYNWLRRRIYDMSPLNDAKNIIFASMLLDKLNAQEELRGIVDFCFGKILKDEVRFHDRTYYAWTLWYYRKLRKDRDISRIVDFVQNTLQNITQVISEGVIDESLIDMYGHESVPGFSKILLATALDLLIDFNRSKLTISLPLRIYIEQQLRKLGWTDVLRELDNALKAFEEGRTGDCCNNLRMGLITLMVKMYETLTKKSAPTPPGKTTDIRPLIRTLEQHGLSKDTGSNIRMTWSYVSERAHIEKRGGLPPSECETRYGLQMTFAAVEFLLRFYSAK